MLVDADRVVLGHDKSGDAAVARVLVRLGVDRVPVGVAAVGDEALRSVDEVLVAPPHRGRAPWPDRWRRAWSLPRRIPRRALRRSGSPPDKTRPRRRTARAGGSSSARAPTPCR